MQTIKMKNAGEVEIPDEVGPTVGDLKRFLEQKYPGDEPVDTVQAGVLRLLDKMQKVKEEMEKK